MYRVTGTLANGKTFSGSVDARNPLDAMEVARKKLPEGEAVNEIKVKKIDDDSGFKIADARARKPKTAAAPEATTTAAATPAGKKK